MTDGVKNPFLTRTDNFGRKEIIAYCKKISDVWDINIAVVIICSCLYCLEHLNGKTETRKTKTGKNRFNGYSKLGKLIWIASFPDSHLPIMLQALLILKSFKNETQSWKKKPI